MLQRAKVLCPWLILHTNPKPTDKNRSAAGANVAGVHRHFDNLEEVYRSTPPNRRAERTLFLDEKKIGPDGDKVAQANESREVMSTVRADRLLNGQQLRTAPDMDASGVKTSYMICTHAQRPVLGGEEELCQIQVAQIIACAHVQPGDYDRPGDEPVLGVGSEVEDIKTITTDCGVSTCASFTVLLEYILSTKRTELAAVGLDEGTEEGRPYLPLFVHFDGCTSHGVKVGENFVSDKKILAVLKKHDARPIIFPANSGNRLDVCDLGINRFWDQQWKSFGLALKQVQSGPDFWIKVPSSEELLEAYKQKTPSAGLWVERRDRTHNHRTLTGADTVAVRLDTLDLKYTRRNRLFITATVLKHRKDAVNAIAQHAMREGGMWLDKDGVFVMSRRDVLAGLGEGDGDPKKVRLRVLPMRRCDEGMASVLDARNELNKVLAHPHSAATFHQGVGSAFQHLLNTGVYTTLVTGAKLQMDLAASLPTLAKRPRRGKANRSTKRDAEGNPCIDPTGVESGRAHDDANPQCFTCRQPGHKRHTNALCGSVEAVRYRARKGTPLLLDPDISLLPDDLPVSRVVVPSAIGFTPPLPTMLD